MPAPALTPPSPSPARPVAPDSPVALDSPFALDRMCRLPPERE